jgi:hypothetical protein
MSMELPSVLHAGQPREAAPGLGIGGENRRPYAWTSSPSRSTSNSIAPIKMIAVRRRESLEYPGVSKMAAGRPPQAADSCNRFLAQGF